MPVAQGTTWIWRKVDDLLTNLPDLIRKLNTSMKKLEQSFASTQVRLTAVGTFTDGATTPSIANARTWKTNNATAPTSITNFSGAAAGDQFTLVIGDANTTIVNDTTKIRTKTGANRVMSNNQVTQFVTHDGVVWREVPTP